MLQKVLKYSTTVIFLSVIILTAINFQWIVDQVSLYGYRPTQEIQSIAKDTTMTDYGQRLFFVNRPILQSKAEFRNSCQTISEKTVILGCYHGKNNGIFILNVNDPRLDGIKEVTAAHEMLHVAYARLSESERNTIDNQLSEYRKSITDQQILDTLKSYREHDPSSELNEMHSIFGSEIANLPEDLEIYYQRYFTDRSRTTSLAANYQKTFRDLDKQLQDNRRRIDSLAKAINNHQADLTSQQKQLQSTKQTLDTLLSNQNIIAYNAAVPSFNQSVAAYNALNQRTRQEIDKHNQLIETHNKLSITINQLNHILDTNNDPIVAEPKDKQ